MEKIFRNSRKAGLVPYNVFIRVPHYGINPIPALPIRSAMLAKIERQIRDLTVLPEARDSLIVYGTISANSPLDAISLFDDTLLQSVVMTGQSGEFDVSMRSMTVSPAPRE